MDFDKVERFYAQTGIAEFDEDTCVSSETFNLLHTAYKETCRALEIAVDDLNAISGGDIWNVDQHLATARLQLRNNLSRTGEACTELAQEAMQGRAE